MTTKAKIRLGLDPKSPTNFDCVIDGITEASSNNWFSNDKKDLYAFENARQMVYHYHGVETTLKDVVDNSVTCLCNRSLRKFSEIQQGLIYIMSSQARVCEGCRSVAPLDLQALFMTL